MPGVERLPGNRVSPDPAVADPRGGRSGSDIMAGWYLART